MMKVPGMLLLLVCTGVFVSAGAAQKARAPKTSPPAKTAKSNPATQRAAESDSDETLARTYMVTKRYTEAAALYEKLAKANPRNANYWNMAGVALMQTGDLKGARKRFERSIKVSPAFADAYNNIGATWYTEKNFKRALQFYQRAVKLQPGVASYHTNVGFAYFNLKKPEDAEQAFRRALLMDPTIFEQNSRNGSILQDRSVSDQGLFAFTMARSYAGTGDAAHCASYLRRALDEGYKDMAAVYSDPNFAGVLADPGVKTVLSMVPAAPGQAAAPQSQ
jgi:tetratricopeptide (TPR) repeat protein